MDRLSFYGNFQFTLITSTRLEFGVYIIRNEEMNSEFLCLFSNVVFSHSLEWKRRVFLKKIARTGHNREDQDKEHGHKWQKVQFFGSSGCLVLVLIILIVMVSSAVVALRGVIKIMIIVGGSSEKHIKNILRSELLVLAMILRVLFLRSIFTITIISGSLFWIT
jgi:hypothetical protein